MGKALTWGPFAKKPIQDTLCSCVEVGWVFLDALLENGNQ
jgi:hypothetical protein